MSKCKACDDKFLWDDRLVVVEDDCYHVDCVTLYPTGYVAMLDDDCLGETENEDGQDACDVFPELLDD
ncbi:hypothetical protein EH196_06870 [Bacillus sp. C1-1]|nr:hypothetical protein EH196_06870 [Bacillus sp. C1-1]